MHEKLMEEAEALVRSGVRRISAERLRGQVQIISWSSVRQAFEGAMDQLRREVDRLARESEKQKASAQVVPGETLERKAARLEREVKELRERVAQYEEACDALDLIEDFDLANFEGVCETLKMRAEQVEGLCGGKISLQPKIDELLPVARESEQLLSQNLSRMFEGTGDMQVFLTLVRLGREFRMLWQKVRCVEQAIDLVTRVVR